MTSTRLRPPRADELPRIAAWAMAEGWPGRSKGVPLDAAEFAAIAGLPGHHSHCLADAADVPVAFGQVWIDVGGAVNLIRIVVDPARRRQGFGLELSRHLLAEARRLAQGGVVRLRVRRDNEAAIRVYRTLGFQVNEAGSNAVALAMVSDGV
jgi:ribosomal protein S18 acetylase RimI-like enzyme